MNRMSVLFVAIMTSLAVVCGIASAEVSVAKAAITIDLSKTGEPVSKYIYGQFIEHLGKCVYDGIWAEMLKDRKFYYPVASEKSRWKTIGRMGVAMVKRDSFVGEHTPSIPRSGGIRQGRLALVKGKRYVGYVWMKPTQKGKTAVLEVALRWGRDPNLAHRTTFSNDTDEYVRYPFEFTNDESGVPALAGWFLFPLGFSVFACETEYSSLIPALRAISPDNTPEILFPGTGVMFDGQFQWGHSTVGTFCQFYDMDVIGVNIEGLDGFLYDSF